VVSLVTLYRSEKALHAQGSWRIRPRLPARRVTALLQQRQIGLDREPQLRPLLAGDKLAPGLLPLRLGRIGALTEQHPRRLP
jgi:hypothetical protein